MLYLVHEEHLKGQLKQKAKMHANKMMEAYHRFIHDFFSCFPREQQNELIAMMDALDTHIHNDIEVLRMQAQNVVIEMPPEQRNIFSAVAAVRVLSANIKYSWQSIYRRSASEAIPNKDIESTITGANCSESTRRTRLATLNIQIWGIIRTFSRRRKR